MPRRRPLKIRAELLHHILQTLIWKVGLERLRKPDAALRKRIAEGWRRFEWELDVKSAGSGLEELAGLPPARAPLDSIRFELPNLRKSKPVLSRIRLRADYAAALARARAVFRTNPSPRRGPRIAPVDALAAGFPGVPRTTFVDCSTPRAAAPEAVTYHHRQQGLSSATIGHLVNSKPKNRQAALDWERRAADLDPATRTAIRIALAQTDLRKLARK
jgi:hypothetical protein